MTKRKTTRRDFFRGSAARDAIAGRLDGVASEPVSTGGDPGSPDVGVLRVGRKAMAAEFELFFNAGQYPEATEAALAALDEVDRIEEQLSYFRATSEVSRINQLAQSEPLPIDADLFELLELAARLHGETDGALDITAGPLSEVWGFARRKGTIPTNEQLDEARSRVGSDKLELNSNGQTARLGVPGMRINLGAIGKGYALDRSAAILAERGIEDFLMHGGQSSVVARGSRGNPGFAPNRGEPTGWTVGVHDPTRHGRRLAEIRLCNRALATSSSEKQFFRHQGRRYSHILDPRTGQPAEGLVSATVVAPSAVLADGLSTALFVLGADHALTFCEARPELAVLLVRAEGSQIEVLSSGFTPGELEILGL
ncbi:MAG: FAD:protein FMN transferase [Pirellulaceae bacterium]|nr:FAD:protein FMN transferase [Pirellulaceae bacterium]